MNGSVSILFICYGYWLFAYICMRICVCVCINTHYACSSLCFSFIYLFTFALFLYQMLYDAKRKIHAFVKFQHIFTLTLNIWLMPIWNGKPHSTKPNQTVPNQVGKRKKKYSIYGPLCMIWCETKERKRKMRIADIFSFFLLETTIFILNKFLAKINFMCDSKKGKITKVEKKSVSRN